MYIKIQTVDVNKETHPANPTVGFSSITEYRLRVAPPATRNDRREIRFVRHWSANLKVSFCPSPIPFPPVKVVYKDDEVAVVLPTVPLILLTDLDLLPLSFRK